jgi:hypothetical protein
MCPCWCRSLCTPAATPHAAANTAPASVFPCAPPHTPHPRVSGTALNTSGRQRTARADEGSIFAAGLCCLRCGACAACGPIQSSVQPLTAYSRCTRPPLPAPTQVWSLTEARSVAVPVRSVLLCNILENLAGVPARHAYLEEDQGDLAALSSADTSGFLTRAADDQGAPPPAPKHILCSVPASAAGIFAVAVRPVGDAGGCAVPATRLLLAGREFGTLG